MAFPDRKTYSVGTLWVKAGQLDYWVKVAALLCLEVLELGSLDAIAEDFLNPWQRSPP
jgi:hypothetical protein